ncbi:pyridoxamine 5'-phosphate oxidase family protein [Nonomuraea sp. NBC_01738]|uniref:pyridoxamine 5'-phosphate oxidase family protein n=1 Tax=Nonomuraea sp. NBC_01738 TaxID=2976003 RepID=UPI002E13AD01|nr:pyridoxamine 5'-phosphate oxidase family protein [Nonomuraea sp. NBC_01738]
MHVDSSGLTILPEHECLALLGSAEIGRIVFTDRALPAVQPVNFHLDGNTLVIRTGAGSKLAAATRDAIVAFETDEFDSAARTGWSVTAVGHARAVEDPAELARLAALPLWPWAPGERDHYIVVSVERLSGRRITPAPPSGSASHPRPAAPPPACP